MLGQLVDSDYLLDFDIYHVSHFTELLHYIDAKYLSSELGGTNDLEVDTWLNIQVQSPLLNIKLLLVLTPLSLFQHHVDTFTSRYGATTLCQTSVSSTFLALPK